MNRRMVLGLAVVTTVGVTSSMAGCNRDSPSAGGSGAPAPIVGVDYPRSDTDFWNSYIRYVPGSAKALGVELKTTNSQNDVATLISNVQTFVSQGVKGVVMAPQDTAAIAPTLEQLAARKIPVVTIDTRPDTGSVAMVVRADNRAYGTKACRFLGTKLGGKGKVVMLQGDLASINGRDRTEAFNDCMKKDFPGIKVFGEITDWKGDVAASKLQTRLASERPEACLRRLQRRDPRGAQGHRGRPHRRHGQPARRPVREVRALLRQGRDRRQDVPARTDRSRQHHHRGARRPARGSALRAAGHRGRRDDRR